MTTSRFSKFKQIPEVPKTDNKALTNFLTPIKHILEVYQGNMGSADGLDRVVRFRDLTKDFLNKILGTTTTATEGSTDAGTVSSDAIQVAVIGDSLSQAHVFRDTWVWQFKRLSDQMGLPITIKNWAVSGDTFQLAHTDHTEHESGTRSQVEQAVAHGADIVFIALGINDGIFVGGQTAQEIIDDAYAVFDELRAGLPNAKLVYVEEAPHDIDTVDLIPSALTNDECIPWCHGLITYLGKNNCRVNNATYEGTASAKLTEHQTWGTATTGIRTIFDDFFTVNIWKMTKMGCKVDQIGHLDTFGHMVFAHTVLKWFKNNNDVDNGVLNIDLWQSSTDSYLIDPDELYTLVMARDAKAAIVGRYSGIDIFVRAEGWFYEQAQFKPSIGPSDLCNAIFPITVVMENCEANRSVWLSWNDQNFIDSNKNTTAYGDFHHVWIGPELSTAYDWTAGTKNLAYAVELSSGNYDVHVVPIVLSEPPHRSHVRARRDTAQSMAHGAYTTVIFNVEEYDTIGEYSTSTGKFTADEPGYYNVTASACSDSVAWGASSHWTIWVYKQGSAYACGDVNVVGGITTNKSARVATTVELSTGEYIEIKIYHNQGGSVNVRGDNPGLRFNYIAIDRATL